MLFIEIFLLQALFGGHGGHGGAHGGAQGGQPAGGYEQGQGEYNQTGGYPGQGQQQVQPQPCETEVSEYLQCTLQGWLITCLT